MRAVVQRRYGTAALRVEVLPKPEPGAGEVLVRVRAAALTQAEWHLMTGRPYLVRCLGFGLRRPKSPVPGGSIAGTVAAVGPGVTGLAPGDEVFGVCRGAFAEFAVATPDLLAPMPERLDHRQAAAVSHGGLTALQALRDVAKVRPGERVLVVGASGAVGTMAVQIAKAGAAEVTGVCSAAKAEAVRRLGAERVLDYRTADFAAGPTRYDVILDLVGGCSNGDLRRALTRAGRAVLVSGGGGRWLGGMGRVLRGALASTFTRRKLLPMMAKPARGDLIELGRMIDAGALTPQLDRVFELDRVTDAVARLESGAASGTIVLVA